MKKILVLFVCFIIGSVTFASEQDEVLKFFQAYIKAANNYESNLFTKYYTANPTIYRVVEKPDGTRPSIKVPFSVYKKESLKGQAFGKIIKYKNNYTNIKIVKSGKDYKVLAIRKPSPGGSYPAYFIIGKEVGVWKIKVESMNTPRKEFLR